MDTSAWQLVRSLPCAIGASTVTEPEEQANHTRPNKGVPLPPSLRKPTKKTAKPRTLKGKRGDAVLREVREQKKTERRKVVVKYDWDYARETFISADPPISLKQLSDDLDIPYNYLRQRSSEERWQYLRVEEQRRLFKKKREEHARSVLEKSLKFDESSISTATLGQQLVMARLAEIADLHRAMTPVMQNSIQNIRAGVPVQKHDLYSAIRYTELRELAVAAKLFQDMGRTAFGVDALAKDMEFGENEGIEHVISVAAELGKDDPARLTAILEAYERVGMVEILMNAMPDGAEEEDDSNEVIEGDIVPAHANGHNSGNGHSHLDPTHLRELEP